MDPIHIIITDQPLGMTGYGAVVVSPEVAFAGIVFLTLICGYFSYRWIVWAYSILTYHSSPEE